MKRTLESGMLVAIETVVPMIPTIGAYVWTSPKIKHDSEWCGPRPELILLLDIARLVVLITSCKTGDALIGAEFYLGAGMLEVVSMHLNWIKSRR